MVTSTTSTTILPETEDDDGADEVWMPEMFFQFVFTDPGTDEQYLLVKLDMWEGYTFSVSLPSEKQLVIKLKRAIVTDEAGNTVRASDTLGEVFTAMNGNEELTYSEFQKAARTEKGRALQEALAEYEGREKHIYIPLQASVLRRRENISVTDQRVRGPYGEPHRIIVIEMLCAREEEDDVELEVVPQAKRARLHKDLVQQQNVSTNTNIAINAPVMQSPYVKKLFGTDITNSPR
jgi:hypothetical protein